MTGASGFCAAMRRHRALEGEIRVDLVGEQREVVAVGKLHKRRAGRQSG